MRLREWLAQAADRLASGPHPDRARRDAETLFLHHTGKSRAWLLTHLEDEFAGCGAMGYAALLDRRLGGEPIQYILGECEFYGMPFRVTPDVLIPRPETEHLVELALAALESTASCTTPRILDVGTGSGAIAVALARALPSAQVTAVDLSSAALDVARSNAERNAVSVRFLEGDLIAPVADESFELIVSNPPYVPHSDRALISVEVREYEPSLALFGGADGLDIYRRLLPAAFAALVPSGSLLVEIGFTQAAAVEELFAAAGFEQIHITPDLQGIPRVIAARRP